jgi:hypothetical protein
MILKISFNCIRMILCVIHDRRLQRRAINRPARSSSLLKQAKFGSAGFGFYPEIYFGATDSRELHPDDSIHLTI